jgi:hypothetical protein
LPMTAILRRPGSISRKISHRLLTSSVDCIDSPVTLAFYGEVPILGTPYMTGYEPIKDSSGAQIGVYYVGYKK